MNVAEEITHQSSQIALTKAPESTSGACKGNRVIVIQALLIRRWAVGLTVAPLAAGIPCSMGQPKRGPTLVIDSASFKERNVFDVRFKKVDIRACQIWDAVVSLAEEIEKRSGGKRHFPVFLESDRTREYLNKQIPVSEWDLSGPKIDFAGSNLTLEAIINALCLKAGWSYDDHTPAGTMFTDSKRLPKPTR